MSTGGLSKSSEQFIGKVLFVQSAYGYGWTDGKTIIEQPEDFEIRLKTLWSSDGVIRGGIADVVSPGHELFGKWIVFSTRYDKVYDFVDKVDLYNISVVENEPELKAGLPKVEPEKSGWAKILASPTSRIGP